MKEDENGMYVYGNKRDQRVTHTSSIIIVNPNLEALVTSNIGATVSSWQILGKPSL